MEYKHLYGYASLRTGQKKNELIVNFTKTKLYNDYIDIVSTLLDNMFYVPEDERVPNYRLIEDNMKFDSEKVLQVDIMTSARAGMHHKLDCIIEQAIEKSFLPFNTVIVINSISAFGGCANIKKYYRIFREARIGVLFPDYTRESGLSEYSTCGFDFEPRSQSEYDRAFDLVERLEEDDIPDNRGRIGSDYTNSFRIAFWLYELFRVSEKVAVKMSGYSKNGFHMKANSYEQTVNYKKELEIFEEHFSISKLIKRNRPVPENFDKLVHWYEKKGSLELACIHCKVPMIFPIDYKRLVLKDQGGKKELARCLKLYDEDLMSQFEEWVQTGKEPTEFYKTYDFEQFLFNS